MEIESSKLSPEALAYEMPGMWTEEWFSEDDDVRVREISKFIPTNTHHLLDVGCGNGLFLHFLRENRKDIDRLCGAERSGSAIAHVRTEKVQASIDDLPFSDGEFDIVTSLEVLEHLPVRTLAGAVKEISRIAKKHILITVPYAQDLSVGMTICPSCHCHFNADYHVRSFNEKNLASLFDGLGFNCREVFYIRPRHVLHGRLAKIVDLVRIMKHKATGLDRGYPSYAVCPACGFQDATKSVAATSAVRRGTRVPMGQRFLRALSWKTSYRWIGAIFERDANGN